MLLIDWLEAVDYHGPLVTRYLMMREERDERRGGEGEGGGERKEGWKLDEHGQCSHHQISLTLLLISVYSAVAHLYTACAKIDFVHLCVFVYHLDVHVWSQPTHVCSPAAFP